MVLLSFLMLSLLVIPQSLQKSVSAGAALQRGQQPQAHRNNSVYFQSRPQAGVFVMRQEKQTVICHDASPLETQALTAQPDADLQLQVVTDDAHSVAPLQKANGLTIILRGTSQLDTHPQAKAALLRAATTWMGLIKNKITVIIDVDFGTTRFGAVYSPDVLGVARVQQVGVTALYTDVRQRLLDSATNRHETAIYNSLPQDRLLTESGTMQNIAAPTSVFRSLGLLSAHADPTNESTTLGEPPAISFNSAFDFDFDPRDGVDAGKVDFEGIALHQIGHLLGFVSETTERDAVPTSPTFVTTWDMFHFQPDVAAGSFTERIPTNTEEIFFTNANQAPLANGRFLNKGRAERSASHWKTRRSGGEFPGIMEATLRFGQQLTITQNDLEAMEYIGHAVSIAPAEADDTIALTSGTPMAGTTPEPSPDTCLLNPIQYTIQVPNTATALKIDLLGVPNLDLFVRINGYVIANGSNVFANFYSISDGGNESITVTAAPSSTLPSGTYYIAIGNCGGGAGNFTLTATVTKPNSAPALNTFAARLDGDLLNLRGTATDVDGDIVKASVKLLDASGGELVTLPNIPVNFEAQSGNYSIALNGLSQSSALSVVRANLVLTDAAGNSTGAMSASFNQADAGGAFIKNVSFDDEGSVMVFKGSPFTSGMQVEINGVRVTPPLNAKLKGAKIKLPGTAAQMGLRKGTNRVRLLLNGAYSNLFLLKN
jgi:hypothetical protein